MTVVKLRPALAEIKSLLSADKDFLKPLVRTVLQEVLEAEMTEALAAAKGERAEGRLGYRSGHCSRSLVTRIVTVLGYSELDLARRNTPQSSLRPLAGSPM